MVEGVREGGSGLTSGEAGRDAVAAGQKGKLLRKSVREGLVNNGADIPVRDGSISGAVNWGEGERGCV